MALAISFTERTGETVSSFLCCCYLRGYSVCGYEMAAFQNRNDFTGTVCHKTYFLVNSRVKNTALPSEVKFSMMPLV